MLPFEMRTYNGSQQPDALTIYILMKGLNSGKPSRSPFTNSLALISETPEAADRVFTAATAIHHSKVFENYLIGSVIPFIRVYDVKQVYSAYVHLFTAPNEKEHLALHHYLRLSDTIQQQHSTVKHIITAFARKIVGI